MYSGGTYLSLIEMVMILLTISSFHITMLPSIDIFKEIHLVTDALETQTVVYMVFI